MVLRDRQGRRGRRGTAEKVKWLGVLLDDELDFGPHWEYRIGKARKLLGAIDGVGNSAWGMSPLTWRQAYTGMIRAVAAWGVEIGWQGQREWREMMGKLQYQALRKCTGAVVGAEKVLVRQIAAVEDVETFSEAAQGRFLARAISDPGRAGVPDPPRGIDGELSLGGSCCRGSIEVVDLGCTRESGTEVWEEAIRAGRVESRVVYTDGSMTEGLVGGGWVCEGVGGGSVALGS